MNVKHQEIVEECLELLHHGWSLAECLERYPEEAAELEPILRTAVSARSDLAIDLPEETRARMRHQVMAEWDWRQEPKRWGIRIPSPFPSLALFPRWAFVAASLVVVLVLGGLGTDTAAAHTVPGDFLYPVKEFREAAQLWFTRSPEAKVEMYTNLVKERVDEVKKVAAREQADLDAISDSLARMEDHLTGFNSVVANKLTDSAAEEVDLGFVAALQRSLSEQDTAGDLLEKALDAVPAEARPNFSNALKAIESARERIDAALETVGHSGLND